METYQSYYGRIEKPWFAPEPEVFGIAWGIIYPLIAIAFAITLYKVFKNTLEKKVLALFALNMVTNFAFTPLQLGYTEAPWATIDILGVLVTLLWLQVLLVQKKEKLLFVLLLPYTLWASFATVLQITIYTLNFS